PPRPTANDHGRVGSPHPRHHAEGGRLALGRTTACIDRVARPRSRFMKLEALHRALANRSPSPIPFVDVMGIDWADPEIGRRYLRYGRRNDEQTAEELAFLHRTIDIDEGTRVLDAMCGDGRLSIPLAATGCEVLGIDINPWVVSRAIAIAEVRE